MSDVMDRKQLLLIFVRNPVLGKVKTRLAKDVGAANALRIYRRLLAHTREVTGNLTCAKHVYYSEFIPETDQWDDRLYTRQLQRGQGLGERMANAFRAGFAAGYGSVVVIGSDCRELTAGIVETAFDRLQQYDVVIGPALDGGYYLLGMKELHKDIFENKVWGTAGVMRATLADVARLGLSCSRLPALNDIDTVDDLGTWDER